MMLQWKAQKHAAIGHCIYCGCSCGVLTKEHIIPFALLPKGGDWYLPRATCDPCAKITGAFEGRCISGMFDKLRIHLNLKQRKRPGRKKRTPGDIIQVKAAINEYGSVFETVSMRIADFPMVGLGIRWPLPGILRGEAPSELLVGEQVIKEREGDIKKFARPGRGMHIGKLTPNDLALMLAKIAHAYAVSKKIAFKPFLPDLILGKYNKYAYLIGGDTLSPLEDQPTVIHHVHPSQAVVNGVAYLVVSIRLFAFMELPRYLVVVGEATT
jgi:hypothetical protein